MKGGSLERVSGLSGRQRDVFPNVKMFALARVDKTIISTAKS